MLVELIKNIFMVIKHYSALMKFIHWAMAVQIIVLLVIGFYMSDLSWGDSRKILVMVHKSCGVTAIVFIIARIFARLFTQVPESSGNFAVKFTSQLTSFFLYVFMAAMAFSGFIMSDMGGHVITFFNLIDLPLLFKKNEDLAKKFHAIHVCIALPLVILIGLHLLGALYHHFILRDNVLTRMLPRVCSRK